MAKQNDRLELKIVSPAGIAQYPKLHTPDTKFDAAGVYEVKLRFNPDDAVAVLDKKKIPWSELKDAIDAQQAEFMAEKKAELAKGDGKNKNKAKTIESIEWGAEPDLDDGGNETGMVVIKAKMKSSGTGKDGKKWTRKPKLFDAKGKPLPEDGPQVWGGSVLKVSGKIVPYYMPKENEVGSTFYMDAVQVITLVSGQGREAGDYGFGEEEGYAAEEETTSQFEGEAESETEGAGGNF